MKLIFLRRPGAALVLLCGFAGTLIAPPALAALFEGTGQNTVCISTQDVCQGLGFKPNVKARVNWQVSTLVGEPVVDTRLSWEVGNFSEHVAPIYGAADPLLSFNGEASSQLRLYDAKARLTVYHGNRRYTIDSDLGVPDQPGDKLSYNVPGSPDWSRMFRDENGRFIPAENAKEIIGSGAMQGASAELVSARIDTSKFEEWWLEKNAGRYTAPLRDAIDARLEAMEEAFGLPTEEIRAEIRALGQGMRAEAVIGKLETILGKLAPDRIPAKFLGEGPERLAKLKAYAERIGPTEADLRAATKGLPPMPGRSERFESWYDQVAARMNSDAARLARLQNLQEEADRLEREAEEARLREAERLAAAADRQRREDEERRQREWEEAADQTYYDYGGYMAGFSDSFASSGWGDPFGMGGAWGGAHACGYSSMIFDEGTCADIFGGSGDGAQSECSKSGHDFCVCALESADRHGTKITEDSPLGLSQCVQ